MAFGGTDKVETPVWGARSLRADAPRAAVSPQPRFDAMLSQTESARPPAASAADPRARSASRIADQRAAEQRASEQKATDRRMAANAARRDDDGDRAEAARSSAIDRTSSATRKAERPEAKADRTREARADDTPRPREDSTATRSKTDASQRITSDNAQAKPGPAAADAGDGSDRGAPAEPGKAGEAKTASTETASTETASTETTSTKTAPVEAATAKTGADETEAAKVASAQNGQAPGAQLQAGPMQAGSPLSGEAQTGDAKGDSDTTESDKADLTPSDAPKMVAAGQTMLVPPTPLVPPPPSAPPVPATGGAAPGASPPNGAQAVGPVVAGGGRGAAVAVAESGDAGQADGTTETGGPGPAKDFLAALSAVDQGQATPTGAGPAAPSSTVPAASGSGAAAAATATQAATTAAQAGPAAPPMPLGQVPMAIGLRALAGSSEFQIRLDPAELGRIEVKLAIDKAKGTVSTHLTVDRPDTLALLQRDAGQLQQALAQAGLDPAAGGINLSLRGDGGQQAGGQAGGQGERTGGGPGAGTPWSADRTEIAADAIPYQRLRGYGGLDIRI